MDWFPFRVCAEQERAPSPRGLTTEAGLGDRLRTAAFAERQAAAAFAWAAERFPEAPADRRELWRSLAAEEARHLGLLLERMAELGVGVDERPVSDGLWRSLARCQTWQEFAARMRLAEERGHAAEVSFQRALESRDPRTAALFAAIAEDERRHIASY